MSLSKRYILIDLIAFIDAMFASFTQELIDLDFHMHVYIGWDVCVEWLYRCQLFIIN